MTTRRCERGSDGDDAGDGDSADERRAGRVLLGDGVH